jgi:Uma2 family endonuclease
MQGSLPLGRLVFQIQQYLAKNNLTGEFAFEVDMVVNRVRVPKVDAVFLTPDQLRQQAAIDAGRKGRPMLRLARLRVAPELVIESLSLGHELHDRQTKRQWYSGFGIPNYWLFDAYRRTLECLRLKDGDYQVDVAGKESELISIGMLPGLIVELGKIWI